MSKVTKPLLLGIAAFLVISYILKKLYFVVHINLGFTQLLLIAGGAILIIYFILNSFLGSSKNN